jgi:N-acetylmuramoyl-L-alanine amidase
LRFTLKKHKCLFITALLVSIIFHLSAGQPEGYIPVKSIAANHGLETVHDPLKGTLTLSGQGKSIELSLHSSVIKTGSGFVHTRELVLSEQGQFLVSAGTAALLNGYLTGKKMVLAERDDNSSSIPESGEWFLNSVDDPQRHSTEKSDIVREIESQADENHKHSDTLLNNKITEKSDSAQDDDTTVMVDTDTKSIDEKSHVHTIEPDDVTINAIIIDPGHGGKDPGAVGYNSIREKDIVLRTGLILKEKLKKEFPDKRIILTRDTDVFIPLDKRANIANYVYNKYGASLFISLHANASRSSKPYGFETWYLIGEYRRNVLKKSDAIDDPEVAEIINSMINDEIYSESKMLAGLIQDGLESNIGYVSRNRGIKEEVYFVIKKAIMPAVLVEIGFNTNKYEAIRLTKYSYLTKIAQGIFEGTRKFVNAYEDTVGYTE